MHLRSLSLVQQASVAASPEQVWAVFEDIRRWPEWNRIVREVAILEGEPWKPGFRFRMVLRMGGFNIPFEPTVVEADPPHSVTWRSTRLKITGTRTFTFELVEGMARLRDVKLFESKLIPVALVYPRPIIRGMSEHWLRALTYEVERTL